MLLPTRPCQYISVLGIMQYMHIELPSRILSTLTKIWPTLLFISSDKWYYIYIMAPFDQLITGYAIGWRVRRDWYIRVSYRDWYQKVAEEVTKCFLCSLSYAQVACEWLTGFSNKTNYNYREYVITAGRFHKFHKSCPFKTITKNSFRI